VFMVTRRVSTCTIVGVCNEELSTNSYNNDFTSPIVEHVVDQVRPLSVQIAKLTAYGINFAQHAWQRYA
jgi:hypothetical protein